MSTWKTFVHDAHTRWTTVIEHKVGRNWQFFSQQSIRENELGKDDTGYLDACRKEFPNETLRIQPKGEIPVSTSTKPVTHTPTLGEIDHMLTDRVFTIEAAMWLRERHGELLAALEAVNAQLLDVYRNTNRSVPYGYAVCISSDVRAQVQTAISKAKGEL